MNAFPPLHPRHKRESRIAGVLLTNGDLDHVLGLALLREGPPLIVYATAAVRESLGACGIAQMLGAFCGVNWREPGGEPMELEGANGLTARAIFLLGAQPPYMAQRAAHSTGHSVAYQIKDENTGARLLAAPDVSALTPELMEALDGSDVVLFDGTFWSGDELRRVREGARMAEEMGHLPIQGGSLERLGKSPARHKVYFHINNTNPILAPESVERAEAEKAGMIVGYDGLEFEL